MITFVTWRWGTKYGDRYVLRLLRGLERNYHRAFRFVVCTDIRVASGPDVIQTGISDRELLGVDDGCYVRLRMFDRSWQRSLDIEELVCVDLDVVITADITDLFDDAAPFKILHGGHFIPTPFNGSLMYLQAGAHPEVWSAFTANAGRRVSRASGKYLGTDQTWLAHMIPDAHGWTFADGVYGFKKPGWPPGDQLPANARIVAFPGSADPEALTGLDWVREHWR